ncbi:MAG: DUF5947 family protein [Acidobacteriota bacterium]
MKDMDSLPSTPQQFEKPVPPSGPVTSLRRFAQPRPSVEHCDLCGTELGSEHHHLMEPTSRRLLCACQPCAILFPGQQKTKYRRVPQRIRFLPDLRLSDTQWEALMIPINMAFFFQSSQTGKVVALYPSPAGAMESLLPLESWEEIVRVNPVLNGMEADVEALLVNRVSRLQRATAHEYFLAPIDQCYKLVGLIRAHWRGLSGGTEMWEHAERFFAHLKERSGYRKEVCRD